MCRRPKKAGFFLGLGRFWTFCPLRGLSPLQGPLRADRFLRETPLHYRKANGKLRGGISPELGRNFCLCAVDQKKPFFLRVGPFLDLLPFKGPFPLTGALTGRPPYGRPLTGRLLTGRPLTNYRKAYGKLRGGTLPELGGNFRLCAVDQKKVVFSYGWAVSGPSAL